MAKQAGRLAQLTKSSTPIAGVRVLSVTWNGTPIDVTDQGDDGVQTFLANVMASDTLEISVQGLEEDGIIRTAAIAIGNAAKFLADLAFVFPSGHTISGDFILTSYTENGPYDNASDFSATFVRTGANGWANPPPPSPPPGGP